MLWSWKSISQSDTVRIPIETANLIVDDLKELDALRVSNNLDNMLIQILERDRDRLRELLQLERVKLELLKSTRPEPQPATEAQGWVSRTWRDIQRYLVGFAAGVVTILIIGN